MRTTSDFGDPQTDFQHFYQFFLYITEPERYAVPLDLFREFIFDNYPIEKGDLVFGKPCPEKRVMNWYQAAQYYEIGRTHTNTFRKGMAAREHQRFFPIGYYHDDLMKIKNDMSRIEMARFLNIHPGAFDRLTGDGFLKPCFQAPKMRDLYSREEIENLLERFGPMLKTRQRLIPKYSHQFLKPRQHISFRYERSLAAYFLANWQMYF